MINSDWKWHKRSVSRCRVNGSLLGADDEVVDVAGAEAHRRDGYLLGLLALQVDHLLRCVHVVQRPRAEATVVTYADQVVRILRSHHLDAVNRMLFTFIKTRNI